jgi:hypothetical protein
MAAITSAAVWNQIPELSRAKRLGYQARFRAQTIPQKQKRPADSSGRSLLQERVYHSRQIFTVDELLFARKVCVIAAQFFELANRKLCKYVTAK